MLLPLHLPALICGFVCGWPWGLLVGFVLPIARSLLFGMPPLVPTALAMAFEMADTARWRAFCYQRLRPGRGRVYVALIGAMLAGRAVWGLASWLIYALLTQSRFALARVLDGRLCQRMAGHGAAGGAGSADRDGAGTRRMIPLKEK